MTGAHVIHYELLGGSDPSVPYLMNTAMIAPSPDGRVWVWQTEVNATTHDVDWVAHPSALGTYVAADAGTFISHSNSTESKNEGRRDLGGSRRPER